MIKKGIGWSQIWQETSTLGDQLEADNRIMDSVRCQDQNFEIVYDPTK